MEAPYLNRIVLPLRRSLGLRAAAASEGRDAAGHGAGEHARQRPHQAIPAPTSECNVSVQQLLPGHIGLVLSKTKAHFCSGLYIFRNYFEHI